jgi:methionyl aminopeptidase
MSISSPEQFEKLRACGMIVGKALRAMAAAVGPAITTAELCEIGSRVLAKHGARSSPPMVYGFPGDVCVSVNDEVVHGIPGERVLQPGDLVKLDLTAEKDGYHTDSAVSVEVPPAKAQAHELARCAEREVRRRGFHVIKELGGHGIGRTIHEPPSVPNYADFSAQHKLTEGLVITIEPIIAAGTGQVSLDQDRWTYRTVDGSLSAHYEHTIVITRGQPVLLTAA